MLPRQSQSAAGRSRQKRHRSMPAAPALAADGDVEMQVDKAVCREEASDPSHRDGAARQKKKRRLSKSRKAVRALSPQSPSPSPRSPSPSNSPGMPDGPAVADAQPAPTVVARVVATSAGPACASAVDASKGGARNASTASVATAGPRPVADSAAAGSEVVPGSTASFPPRHPGVPPTSQPHDPVAEFRASLVRARKGHAPSMVVVGNRLMKRSGSVVELGLRPEEAHAWVWYKKAAEKGSRPGKRRWANCLLNGSGGISIEEDTMQLEQDKGICLLMELIEENKTVDAFWTHAAQGDLIHFYRKREEDTLFGCYGEEDELRLLIENDRDNRNLLCIYEAGWRLHERLSCLTQAELDKLEETDREEFEFQVHTRRASQYEVDAMEQLRLSSARFADPSDSDSSNAPAWILRWKFAARAQYPPAILSLAKYYFSRDQKQAVDWLRKGAALATRSNNHQSDCLYRLGVCLLQCDRLGAEQEIVRSFEQAYQLGHAGAGFELGRLLLQRAEAEGAAHSAEVWTRVRNLLWTVAKQYKCGEAIAFLLADARRTQPRLLPPPNAANEDINILLREAEASTDQNALYEAHLVLRDGCATLDISADSQRAQQLLQRACQFHHPEAAYQVALQHRARKDWHKAAQCFQVGAKGGHSQSQCEIGICYRDGQGVQPSMQRALEHLSDACAAGLACACFERGMCFLALSKGSFDSWIKARVDFAAGAARDDLRSLHQLALWNWRSAAGEHKTRTEEPPPPRARYHPEIVEACRLLQVCVDQHQCADSAWALAEIYLWRDRHEDASERDVADYRLKVAELLVAAANLGYRAAIVLMAYAFHRGVSWRGWVVEPQPEQAAAYLQRIVSLDLVSLLFELTCAEVPTPSGVESEILIRAASGGHPVACLRLGRRHLGAGETTQASECFQRAKDAKDLLHPGHRRTWLKLLAPFCSTLPRPDDLQQNAAEHWAACYLELFSLGGEVAISWAIRWCNYGKDEAIGRGAFDTLSLGERCFEVACAIRDGDPSLSPRTTELAQIALQRGTACQNLDSTMALGRLCIATRDYRLALSTFRRGAAANDPSCLYFHNLCVEAGYDERKDRGLLGFAWNRETDRPEPNSATKLLCFSSEVFQGFLRSAEGGNCAAMRKVVAYLREPLCPEVPRDLPQAMRWLREAWRSEVRPRDASDFEAIVEMYLDGRATGQPDPAQAVRYLSQLADDKHGGCAWKLACLLRDGVAGIGDGKPNLAGAFARFLQGATEASHPECMYESGRALQDGVGTAVDLVTAARWYEQLIRTTTESPRRLDAAGQLCRMVRAHQLPAEEAFRLLSVGAECVRHLECMHELGLAHRDGIGTDTDPTKAADWFGEILVACSTPSTSTSSPPTAVGVEACRCLVGVLDKLPKEDMVKHCAQIGQWKPPLVVHDRQ